MKILHVINRATVTSIPLELAEEQSKLMDIKVIAFYSSKEQVENIKSQLNSELDIIGLGVKSSFDLQGHIKLHKYIQKIKPDIIHTHHTLSGALTRLFAKFDKNIKVVHTIHANHNSYSLFQNLLIGVTLPICDRIVCNSNNTLRSLKKWQNFIIGKNKKLVVYNGVRIDKIMKHAKCKIRKKYGVEEDTFLIGTVGRLEKVKDHETLIKSFKLIKQKITNSKLIIVGSGRLENKLSSMTESLGLHRDIIFTGTLAREDVYKIINNLDLFIITSRYEGFCNAMVEAMVAENPIIATDVQPLPEVMGKDNGLFFEKGDYSDLASKVIYIYENESLRKQMALRAKRYATVNYSLNKCVNNYLTIYDELVNSIKGENKHC